LGRGVAGRQRGRGAGAPVRPLRAVASARADRPNWRTLDRFTASEMRAVLESHGLKTSGIDYKTFPNESLNKIEMMMLLDWERAGLEPAESHASTWPTPLSEHASLKRWGSSLPDADDVTWHVQDDREQAMAGN